VARTHARTYSESYSDFCWKAPTADFGCQCNLRVWL